MLGRIVQDRYRIVEAAARGRLGTVYRALRLEDGMETAIRLIPGANEEDARNARTAARSLAAATHAGLNPIIETLEHEGGLAIVSPYVRGATLDELIREWAPFDGKTVAEMTAALATALDRLHAAGMAHGNLTARNVMVREPDFCPVLLDAGLERMPGTRGECSPPQASDDLSALKRLTDEMLSSPVKNCGAGAAGAKSGHGTRPTWRRRPLSPLSQRERFFEKSKFALALALGLMAAVIANTSYFAETTTAKYSSSVLPSNEAAGIMEDGADSEFCPRNYAYIPPGRFEMGFLPSQLSYMERRNWTRHPVVVTKGFCIARHEFTQGEWQEVMGNNPSHFLNCGSDCPVDQPTWNDVRNFLVRYNQLRGGGYRLPTSAEWEYAARAGATTDFQNGNMTVGDCRRDPLLDRAAWYCFNSENRTHPVGRKEPNAWGLYDASGNVSELTQDYYSTRYPSVEEIDPKGAASGLSRVVRGGSWIDGGVHCRLSSVASVGMDRSTYASGFRLVRDVDFPDDGGERERSEGP